MVGEVAVVSGASYGIGKYQLFKTKKSLELNLAD